MAHSLSPVLHRAAYSALGLTGWRYDAVDCGADELPGLVGGLGPEWAGLSVTMPGKVAALRVASAATDRARQVGAANTLVRGPDGWSADCTDVDGVTGALRCAGGLGAIRSAAVSDVAVSDVVVLGAGGTARAALAGLAELGARSVLLVVRDPARAAGTLRCAGELGLDARTTGWDPAGVAAACTDADVAVCTVPAEAAGPVANGVARAPTVLDVSYHPWPTPVALAVAARGGRLATGLDMLLHQAFGQVEQFTGRSAPRAAMRDALRAATGGEQPLPC